MSIFEVLAGHDGPVVFDPVLRASDGGLLFLDDPACLLPLVRRATVTTPNLTEAGALAAVPVPTSAAEAEQIGQALRELGARAVLVKGGHLPGAASDVLLQASGTQTFASVRVAGPSPRGTGCALATAMAVGLGRGQTLEHAVGFAKAWLRERIAAARDAGGERHL
jgi:hydroxymethylpyrimidine/phosphomethylpyrimidine kinase